jgi:hypothetical protein
MQDKITIYCGEVQEFENTTNQNCIHEEIMSILKSLLFSCRLSETIILYAVSNGCETHSLILREEHRLRVMRIYRPKGKWWEAGEDCIMRFITCTLPQIFF